MQVVQHQVEQIAHFHFVCVGDAPIHGLIADGSVTFHYCRHMHHHDLCRRAVGSVAPLVCAVVQLLFG